MLSDCSNLTPTGPYQSLDITPLLPLQAIMQQHSKGECTAAWLLALSLVPALAQLRSVFGFTLALIVNDLLCLVIDGKVFDHSQVALYTMGATNLC